MAKGEIRALTSLRGIAASCVVLQHYSATAAGLTDGWLPSLAPHGYMAVDFFFVLSGFIMSYTYSAAFARDGMGAFLPFLGKRVARIAPIVAAVTLTILLLGAVASIWGAESMFVSDDVASHGYALLGLVNVLNLQGFFPDYSINGPSWSVSLECGAYLVFPAFLLVFDRTRPWLTAAATLLSVAGLVGIAALASSGLATRDLAIDVVRIVAEFGLGVLVFRATENPAVASVAGSAAFAWASVLAFAVSAVMRWDIAIALCCPPLVLAFALHRGLLARLLGHPLPYALGTVSFSLYLVHNVMRVPAMHLVRWVHPGQLTTSEGLAFAIAGSLCAIPVAAASYLLVEKPGRTAVRGATERLRRLASRPAPAG